MPDWSKLDTYQNNRFQSFETLCYIIAKKQYGKMGHFTSIDDSGGGDGVEFYLTLPNGEEWGWQAKWYYPNLRLGDGNRKENIKNSLKTACKNHPNLKKWILCTPTSFTVKGGGERAWFDEKLPKFIPDDKEILLEHWGTANFDEWLMDSKYEGLRNYFFGELELSFDWFKNQFEKQLTQIDQKFNPLLHIKPKSEEQIHYLLGDDVFRETYLYHLSHIKEKIIEYYEHVKNIITYKSDQKVWQSSKQYLTNTLEDIKIILDEAREKLSITISHLDEINIEKFQICDIQKLHTKINDLNNKYFEVVERIIADSLSDPDERIKYETLFSLLYNPSNTIVDITNSLDHLILMQHMINQSDFHIIGNAGVGKTHLMSNICNERIESSKPAILILGARFTNSNTIQAQLLDILNIPKTYSWDEFLKSLDIAAQIHKTRIPIIIDGLNEATDGGRFSNLGKIGLDILNHEISQYSNLVLITSCRTPYKNVIWPVEPANQITEEGYNYDNVENAIKTYFSWYKIIGDLTAIPLEQFKHPIYLRLFCEATNPCRQETKHVQIGDYTLFDVFDKYLDDTNNAICARFDMHPNVNIIQSLYAVAESLWESDSRNISLNELAIIIDKQKCDDIRNWHQSKTNALLSEGLLVNRTWNKDEEHIEFTYDLMGGYIIASNILKQNSDDIVNYIKSDICRERLFSREYSKLHPLHDDIGRCLAALLPIEFGIYLHEIIPDNKKAFNISINSLFEIPPSAVKPRAVTLISKLFNNQKYRALLFNRSHSTIGIPKHPLNASFWYKRLKILSMQERDLSWTEYIKTNNEHYFTLIDHFEDLIHNGNLSDKDLEKRLHLIAEHLCWILTSTIRILRDKATRAMYYYGRKYPKKLLILTHKSLEINDPYVSERMLAATYGVAMARQYDFNDASFVKNYLPMYGLLLYRSMFNDKAPYSTTHILSRNYASQTIELALLHHPKLMDIIDQKRIRSPFSEGGIRNWNQSKDKNKDEYRDGNAPLHMDFSNYTVGPLIEGRQNYDFDNEEYKYAIDSIYWRIYSLGYSFEKFKDIDSWIARGNFSQQSYDRYGKVDRYGKKYSWIAYFELTGYMKDNNLLSEFYIRTRLPDIDIDPSFPIPLENRQLISEDFLGNRSLEVHEWIDKGESPNISSYFQIDEIYGEKGPWILIEGFCAQKDFKINRSCFVFHRGIFVKKADIDEIQDYIRKYDRQLWNRGSISIPESFYIFSGEIPWSEIYPYNGMEQLNFTLTTKKVSHPMSDYEVPDEVISFEIFIPTHNNIWESHHSKMTPGRSVFIPAKEITEFLNLCSQPQSFDMYEKTGKKASITIEYEKKNQNVQDLMFLRKDLLDKYLKENDLYFLRTIGGEREFVTDKVEEYDIFDKKNNRYKQFQNICTYQD